MTLPGDASCNPVHPHFERRIAAKLAQLAINHDQCVLRDVVSLVDVCCVSQRPAMDKRLDRRQQLIHRSGVAATPLRQ
jgi:hypothetical protein